MSTTSHCPECHTLLRVSILGSSSTEDLVLQCPLCGYTAFTQRTLPQSVSRLLSELFDEIAKLNPFNLHKTLRDPNASVTDKVITTIARLGRVIMDYKTLIALVVFFSEMLGRRRLGVLVGAAVMACMVLHRDVVSSRLNEQDSTRSDRTSQAHA